MAAPPISPNLDPAQAINIAGIQCWDEGTEEHFNRFGVGRAVRKIRCGWNNSAILINAIFQPGIPPTLTGSYVFPNSYPRVPSWLLSGVEIKGRAGTTGLGFLTYPDPVSGEIPLVAYAEAEMDFIYESQRFDATDSGELEADLDTEVIRPPGYSPSFSFMSNDTGATMTVPPEDTPGIRLIVLGFDYVLRYQTTQFLNAAIAAAQSPVNSTTTTLGRAGQSLSIPAGYLLYQGMRTRYSPVGTGANGWRVSHRFKYRSQPWNCAINTLDPKSVTWATVYYTGSTNMIYPTSDLNVLLNQNQS